MKYKLLSKAVIASSLFASTAAWSEKYEIIEISSDKYRQHFAMGLNNNGQVVGIGRDSFNFPLYLEDSIFNSANFIIDCGISAEENETRELDASSAYCVKAKLAAADNALYQQIGDVKSFSYAANMTEFQVFVDVNDPELGDYTSSNVEQIMAINDASTSVAIVSAPYLPELFEQTGEDAADEPVKYWIRQYETRAAISRDGLVTLIEPQYDLYGGATAATDISNSGFVSGYTSVGLADNVSSVLDSCDTELQPLEVCVWQMQSSNSIYEINAAIWQLDENNNLVNSHIYGLPFVPTDSTTTNYRVRATAVNENGVGVGFTHAQRNPESSSPVVLTLPAIFEDGETKVFLDANEFDGGYASDINDNGVIVGKIQYFENATWEDRFFIYDTKNQELTTPTTFYSTADSSANAVNNEGLVVGQAEYEITNSSVRRKHGFIYNINTEEFFDINDLTECNSEYEIVELRDINDNNQIAATALKLVDKRDGAGEIEYDGNGVALKEEVAVSILLNPIDGEIENCAEEEGEKYKRQGLSFGWSFTLLLSSLIYIRRWFYKKAI